MNGLTKFGHQVPSRTVSAKIEVVGFPKLAKLWPQDRTTIFSLLAFSASPPQSLTFTLHKTATQQLARPHPSQGFIFLFIFLIQRSIRC